MSFDFGLALPDTLSYQQRAGSYWGEVSNTAQREWEQQRARDAADRDGRMQRDIGRGNMDAYRQRLGQFDNHNSVLYGLQRREQTPYNMPNATVATGTTPTTAPPSTSTTTGPQQLLGGPNGEPASTTQSTTTSQTQQPVSTTTTSSSATNQRWVPARQSDLTPAQLRAHQDYIRANYSGVGSAARRESTRRRVEELGLSYDMHGQLLRRATGSAAQTSGLNSLPDQFDISAYDESRSVPTADVSADLNDPSVSASATSTGASTGTGAAPGEIYLGTNDTSSALQMTPDMELMDMSIQDSIRNAQIYARYGRNDLAEQSMNMALTGQAGLHQQENIILLRGVAEGNIDAASRLVERLNGRQPHSAQYVPTPEDHERYVLMVRGSDGTWRNSSQTPISREDLYASFETAVDAVGSAQRRAASAAVENNIRDNRTDMYVADRNYEANLIRTFTEAETARFRAEQEQARSVGAQTRMLTDGDGGIYVTWPTYNSDGTVDINTRQIRVGEVRTPGTNGTTTTQGLVVNQVSTGTVGTTARTN